MTTIQFQINGLTSQQDGERLAQALAVVPGLTGANVSSATGTVTLITHEGRTNPPADEARAIARAAGYELASDFGRDTVRQSWRWLRPRFLSMRSVRA